jgi:hypothetical protein
VGIKIMVLHQKLILCLATIFGFVGVGGKSFAQSQPSMRGSSFEKVLRQSFEVSQNSTLCYAQTNTPRTFDLTRLCGSVGVESNSGGVSSYSGGSNPSASPSGVCNVPSDTASDGSRCGGRAASEKKGGR